MALKLNRADRKFAGIIALVHLIYFILANHYTRIYMGDSFEYIYEAFNIKNHFFFYSGNPALPIEPEYMTQRQPGYPLFLLTVYTFAINNWVVLVLQNLLSVFNICYCRKMFQWIGMAGKYDWLLLLLVIGYPAQFINANTIAPDILLQTFTLLYAGCFLRLSQTRELKNALYMSIWLVAGFMVKPVLYPFTLMHLAIIIFLFAYWKLKIQRPVLIALIPVCAVLLYNYSNFTRTGKFHFSSNQAFNAVYYFNNFITQNQGTDSAARFLAAERHNLEAIPDFTERYDQANARGMQLLQQNFFPYLMFHLKNSARIFIEPGKAEIDLFTGKLTYGKLYSKEQTGFYATIKKNGIGGLRAYIAENRSMLLVVLVLLINCIRSVGLALFFCSKNNPAVIRLFMLLFICYFAIAAGPIANTRYFLPVSLAAMGCSVLGYAGMLQKRALNR